MKRFCSELLYRDLSWRSCGESSCIEICHGGLVKKSCRELLLRDLGGPGISGDLVEGPLIYKSCQVESSCREITYGFPTRRSRDSWRSCLEVLY